MKITVVISCVDGADETIQTEESERAIKFLKQRDHEGSTVVVVVEMNNEQAYALLHLVDERKC